MKAMILAAGRGERMRPLTDTLPKPLIPVQGRPLIEWHLLKLAKCGIQEVVINTAWLSQKLVAHLGSGAQFGLNILWSHEEALGLETAGGIIHALELLGDEPFCLVNGDVWTDYDFAALPKDLGSTLGHLVLVDNPLHHPEGDFGLDSEFLVTELAPKYTFSGISVLSPELFHGLASGRRALRSVFASAISDKRLTGERYQGIWTDVGTPTRLAELEALLKEGAR